MILMSGGTTGTPKGVALRNHNAIALAPNPRDLDDLLDTVEKTRPTAFSGCRPCSTP